MWMRITFLAIFAVLHLFLTFKSRSILIKYCFIGLLFALETYQRHAYPSCVHTKTNDSKFCQEQQGETLFTIIKAS